MDENKQQEFEDLIEFMLQLDFKKINDNEVELISNRFTLKELPAAVQVYINYYFEHLESID